MKTVYSGVSGIFLDIKLVVSAANSFKTQFMQEFYYGKAVILRLTELWFHRIQFVCAESAFASETKATILYRYGLHLIGIVEISTKNLHMLHFSQTELLRRGDQVSTVSRKSNRSPSVMALTWMGRE